METNLQPIIYDQAIDIRFSDLDSYGHVNSKNYIDLVGTARLIYLERTLGVSLQEIAKRGYGFYLKRCTTHFRRPIHGLVSVRCVSHVDKVDGGTFTVKYALKNAEDKVYADGDIDYVIVDLQKGGVVPPNDWMMSFFFKSA